MDVASAGRSESKLFCNPDEMHASFSAECEIKIWQGEQII